MDTQFDQMILDRVSMTREVYATKVKQFGLHVLEPSQAQDFSEIEMGFLKVGVWALQNPAPIFTAICTKQPFTILVGMRPTKRFHLGHLTLMREINWLLQQGGKLMFIVASFEAGMSLSQAELEECISGFRHTYKNFIGSELPESSPVVSDREDRQLRLLEDRVCENLPVSKIKQLYGWKETSSLADFRVASLTASAFLYPQLCFPGQPTLILSDINQAPHAETTQFVARRLKMDPPSISYRHLLPSLRGQEKRMSVKDPESVIFLDESARDASKKLKRAYSGGKPSPEEQRRTGGSPHTCSFFSMLLTLDPENATSTYNNCTAGINLCGDCKSTSIPRLVQRMN